MDNVPHIGLFSEGVPYIFVVISSIFYYPTTKGGWTMLRGVRVSTVCEIEMKIVFRI